MVNKQGSETVMSTSGAKYRMHYMTAACEPCTCITEEHSVPSLFQAKAAALVSTRRPPLLLSHGLHTTDVPHP